MADLKLSQQTAAGALTGSELAYVVQGGNSRRTTTGAIAGLAPGTSLTYDPVTRLLASSTGADVTLPLAGAEAGLISAADQAKLASIVVDRARLTVADVRNNSGVSIPKGCPVYVTGSSGTIKTVALADASLEATAANTLGLAADTIANNSDGLVITEGPLTGLSTAGLTEGQLIWLSETTGGVTSTRPTQPAHGVVLGWCVKTGAGSAGILYVKVDNGLELNELHDVLITSPATGQVLRRAADGLWKNAALAATDIGDSTATGRALLTAADAAAARSAISAEQTGAAAFAQAAAVQRANHTGTQLAATISDFSSAVAVLGTTVGNALRSLVNPSAVAFLRINADNSVTARSASEMRGDLGLGTAAQGTIGTAAGNVVALDGSARLPAVDGSQLTNLPSAPVTSVAGRTGAVTLAVGDIANAAASGAITGSGLTMATARLLGRSTASTGAVEEISVGTGLSLSGGTLSATATGSGTRTISRFKVRDNQSPAANFATLDTRNGVSVLEFDAAADEIAIFVDIISEGTNLSSGVTIFTWFWGDTATSGNVRWEYAIERMNTDIDADSFDTAGLVTTTTASTSGVAAVAQATITAIDGVTAGDPYRLRIRRIGTDATNDTMTGDAQLFAVEVRGVA